MLMHLPRSKPFLTIAFLLAVPVLAIPVSHIEAGHQAMATAPFFLPAATYDPGGQSFSVAVADVNVDGRSDLVVANAGFAEGLIGVLLGRGDGTFQPVVTYNSGGNLAQSVEVADVNGDGKPDLLIANCGYIGVNLCNHSDGLVGVLLGNGDGTFHPVVTYNSGGSTAVSIAVADLNSDGRPDLLAANECGTSQDCGRGSVGVLLGNGDGTFQVAKDYNLGSAINSVVTADVNGDGKLDSLVAMGGIHNNVGVLLGNGDGTFQPVVAYDSGGNNTLSVVVADVNRDGKPDLLVGNQCDMTSNCADGSVGVLLGNGNGTVRPVVNYGSGGPGVWGLAVADLNGDSNPDLIDASSFHNTVGVLLGNGDGTFEAIETFGSGGRLPRFVALADLNGDDKPDIAVANFCNADDCPSGNVGVLLNNTQFDNKPPLITLSATPKFLWPANGTTVPVTVSGTITDAGSGVNARTAAYAVKDEYGKVQPKGTITLDPGGNYSFNILLRASRLGADRDGRRYTITIVASDNAGNDGSKMGMVIVPHDRGH
jgi:hypothetical protein